MALLTTLVTLPLAPVRAVMWLGRTLEREAVRQWTDPVAVRQHIAEVEAAYAGGRLTEAERDEMQDQLVARLLHGRSLVAR